MPTIDFPIRKIWRDIAESHKIPLKHFIQENFLPEAQREQFPILADLSIHLACPYGLGVEIKKDNMTAFEGSNKRLSLAYFSREVKGYSNCTKEQGLIYSDGRRIHILLNENGSGKIEIEDKKVREAKYKLGEDSFGGSFDKHPVGSYGFRQRSANRGLPGVKKFLEVILE